MTSTPRDYDDYREILAGRPLPLAYVDLDMLDKNIHTIANRSRGKKLRVASKSVRCVSALRRIFEASDTFQGVMSFTAAEAVYLSEQGFDDILLGYPIWNPSHVETILRHTTEGHRIVFMVDCTEHLEHLQRIAAQVGIPALICLDIDMSTHFPGLHFGVRRSPVVSVDDVEKLLAVITKSTHLQVEGIMGYEAQIAGVVDAMPGQALKSRLVRWLKARSTPKIAERRAQVVEAIQGHGIELRIVNGGGTGSLHSTGREEVVSEITVGSGFFSPGLFDNYQHFRYMPAAGFAIEVVRKPRPDIVTCAGGGYVASGSPGWDKVPKPYLPDGLTLLPLEAAGEVQTPFKCPEHVELRIGDPVLMRHSKAGELCERFPVLHCIQDGHIVGEWSTYRGDGQCFL